MVFAEGELKKKRSDQNLLNTKESQSIPKIKTFDKFLVKTLNYQLELQIEKCNQLQTASSIHKSNSQKIIDESRKRHQYQIEELEKVIKNLQEKIKSQNSKYQDQVAKLLLSNSIIDELMAENEKLAFQLDLKQS